MINPAPIGSQLSLNVGGSQRTEDLAQKFLNSFTIQSRVEFTKKNIDIYKRFPHEKYRPFDLVKTDRRPRSHDDRGPRSQDLAISVV